MWAACGFAFASAPRCWRESAPVRNGTAAPTRTRYGDGMSERIGDRAWFQKNRRRKLRHCERIHALVATLRRVQSSSTTLRSEWLTFSPPLYSMNPSFRNLFMKKLTRDRVVPTISASVSCDIFGKVR